MKFRTGLQLGAIFPIVMAILVAAGLVARARVSGKVTASLDRVEVLIGSIADLETATRSYLVSPEEQSAAAWQQAREAVGKIIDGTKYGSFLEKLCVERIKHSHEMLGNLFTRMEESVAARKSGASTGSAAAAEMERLNESFFQEIRAMTIEAVRLARAVHDTATANQRETDYIIAPLFGIIALLMAGGVLLVGRRVTDKLASIRVGMGAVSDGRYDYEVSAPGDDAIDRLAQAFNRMSRQMRQSCELLTEETKKHESAAASLRKSNMMIADALERLRRAQGQLIDTERLSALKQVTSGIAHDFNSTLTPILGLTDFMMEFPASLDDREGVVDNLKMINTAVRKTRDQVRRLSEFFKRADETDTKEIDLNNAITESVEMMRPKWQEEAHAAGISIAVTTELGKVPRLHVNEFAIREVLTSLILNSVEAMPNGGNIAISSLADNKWVVITVKDTGQGMSEEVRRRCFEPFFSTKGDEASGMGLTAVHNSVKRHGGEIEIESREETGTTVTVRLPLARAQAAVRKPAVGAVAPSGLKLLLIDDEQWVRRVFTKILRSDGHTVETAADGAEGLEMLKKGAFDVVLVDRAMPGMCGDDVALAVKRQKPGVPVILLTGFGTLMKESGECPNGVDLVVGKPVSVEELRGALITVTTRQQQPAG